jgi:high affinity Mn2+ porin
MNFWIRAYTSLATCHCAIRRVSALWGVGAGLLCTVLSSQAQEAPSTALPLPQASQNEYVDDDRHHVEDWSAHAQLTIVDQYHPSFRSRFSGPNSLAASSSQRETADVTAFLGARLWQGAEIYVNPEIDQGFGLSNTVGVAGYPSGEAYKVGKSDPYLRWNRLFLRQSFRLSEDSEHVDAAANTLAGSKPVDSVVVTVGKFSVPDVFDANTYAHDARVDFLNWSSIDAGAFDYAADAWGYTEGAALEINKGGSSARIGVFALSDVPNSQKLDSSFRQYSLVGEFEQRGSAGGHPGKFSVLGFLNRGRMGSYNDAVSQASKQSTPDTALVRRYASRGGMSINAEQEIRSGLGVFARASANDGTKEAYEFTEINRSFSGGIAAKGDPWGRPDDTFSLAIVRNSLSLPARRYFAAGGIGILIGDGSLLRYGLEKIFETYYSARLLPRLTISGDFQRVISPAYNRDRGPVSIFAIRLHWAV